MTKRIAHVDDDADIRDAVGRILRKHGYQVDHYLTMKELINTLEQGVNLPDLAILDVMVESMDAGLTAYAEIHKRYPQIQTIFLTSLGDMIRPYFDKESNEWVSIMEKPVEPESLLDVIQDRLGQTVK
ncbi:response regulator [Nitrosomonas aestuarii]|uniref:Two-component system, OmpR family, response regulator n=1 Tax=Nitrosomonas aestuarii TaxID=52441 RepID=A0A1I4BW94_9PROT|nr:response regulator [Nitrosomonas aestuarii]PTN12380.1 response regulator receiver domain-containing protein [Nitrosomonas aestuarii]SFK72181.1 two-component system, OmpR family, response regulator [Nitrosomonas aestuarii]